MSVHQIRLAGPWELLSVSDRAEKTDVPGTVCHLPQNRGRRNRCQLPFDTSAFSSMVKNFPGRATLCRSFHQPAGLTEFTEVSLIFVVNHTPIRTFLNDRILEPAEMAIEISAAPDWAMPSSESTPAELWYRVCATITPLLKSFNRLIVELVIDGADRVPQKLKSVTIPDIP